MLLQAPSNLIFSVEIFVLETQGSATSVTDMAKKFWKTKKQKHNNSLHKPLFFIIYFPVLIKQLCYLM